MRLLFVLENYLPHIGGVEIVFKNLCEGLAKRGHKVTIVTHKMPGTREKQKMNGVNVIRVPCLDSRYLFTLASIPEVLRQAEKADVIHTTTYNGAFPAWIGSIVKQKPAVMTVHETWLGKWGEYTNFSTPIALLHEMLEWMIYTITRFDRYICVSNSTKRNLKQVIPEENVMTIHNGFDPKMWEKQHPKKVEALRTLLGLEGRFVIFAAGRPGTSKGFEYLIKAFPKIKKKIPKATLVMLLSKEKQYAHKIEEFKRIAGDNVMILDPKPYNELPIWRQMADCIVVPSTAEGFGYAALEAVATGTPVVASDTTSIPEVIYGKHLLVRPKSANAIANGVFSVHKGSYKKTRKKSFPWSRNIMEHEKVYRSLR